VDSDSLDDALNKVVDLTRPDVDFVDRVWQIIKSNFLL
jgi:hypothetical protein